MDLTCVSQAQFVSFRCQYNYVSYWIHYCVDSFAQHDVDMRENNFQRMSIKLIYFLLLYL